MALLPAEAAAQSPVRQDRFQGDSAALTSKQGMAFVASAMLPGAGQYYLRSDRWVPYVAVEAWAWANYVRFHRDSRRLERNYHDLAWEVARRFTTPARKDSVFTYYEAMGHWNASGRFDSDPQSGGIQPEPDTLTFNGAQWLKARRLFISPGAQVAPGGADYEKALAYYRAHAIPDPYLWGWGNSTLEQQEFNQTISESDAAFRNASRMLGVILANHVVSAVDALIMARLKLLAEHRIRIGSTLEPGSRWTTTVQIPLPGAERGRNSRTNR